MTTEEKQEGGSMSYYAVLQLTPNPLSGECMNIGVLAFDGHGQTCHRLINNWSRVKSFMGHDTRWLERAAGTYLDQFEAVHGPASPSSEWPVNLQLTPARASTLPVEELLERMAS